MKRINKNKPSWFADVRTLNKWRDVQGILFFSGHQCQIVICSCEVPQFIWLARPVRIIEEDGVIVGTFAVNEHIREAQRKAKKDIDPYVWKCGGYVRGLCAFRLNVDPVEINIFDSIPDIRYLNFDERKTLEDKIANVTEVKEKHKRVS